MTIGDVDSDEHGFDEIIRAFERNRFGQKAGVDVEPLSQSQQAALADLLACDTLLDGPPAPSHDRERAFLELLSAFVADRQAGREVALDVYVARWPAFASDVRAWHDVLSRCDPMAQLDPEAAPGIPPFVGKYSILGLLGRGGQGEVFRAYDTALGREVALKVLRHAALAGEEARRRFEMEWRVASRIDHPGVCRVFEAGFAGDLAYISYQFIAGRTLSATIANAKKGGAVETDANDGFAGASALPARDRASVRAVAEIVVRVAEAVEAAHREGVIHRDLNPNNVMIKPDGSPVVLDFGLARETDVSGPKLTATSQVLGTPAYVAPEHIESGATTTGAWTDVYALGVVLYEALTLERPFERPTREALFAAILYETAIPPRKRNPAIPRELSDVVRVAMDRDPGRRYATAADFAADVRRAIDRVPIRARPAGPMLRVLRWTQRRPGLSVALAALTLVLAAAFAITLDLLGKANDARARADDARRRTDEARLQTRLREASLESQGGHWTAVLERLADAEGLSPSPEIVTEIAIARVKAVSALMDQQAIDRELARLKACHANPRQAAAIELLVGDLEFSRLEDREAGYARIEHALASGLLGEADACYARALTTQIYPETVRNLRAALEREPSHRRANEVLGFLLCQVGTLADLRIFAERFRALYADDPRAPIFDAFIAARCESLEAALDRLKPLNGVLPADELRIVGTSLSVVQEVMRPEKIERLLVDGADTLFMAKLIGIARDVATQFGKQADSRSTVGLRLTYPRSLLKLLSDAFAASGRSSDVELLWKILGSVPGTKDLDFASTRALDARSESRSADLPVFHLLAGLVEIKNRPSEQALRELETFRSQVAGTEWERTGTLLALYTTTLLYREGAKNGKPEAAALQTRGRDLVQAMLKSPDVTAWHYEVVGEIAGLLRLPDFARSIAAIHRQVFPSAEAGLAAEAVIAFEDGRFQDAVDIADRYLAVRKRTNVTMVRDAARRRLASAANSRPESR